MVLGRAFEEAWQDVGGNDGVETAEDRRTLLALIILDLAGNGERDLIDLKYNGAGDHAAQRTAGIAQHRARASA